jgi:hypothetical protein
MPVVVKTTEYGESIYAQYADGGEDRTPQERATANRKKLGRRELDEGIV